jgi:hypothetical protein
VPGLVIRYAYLWRAEHLRGQEEGLKDRPCAIVLAATEDEGRLMVTVVPVTHSPPSADTAAVEIPSETKRRLGLDGERSWIVVSKANTFAWPGPDLRPLAAEKPGTLAYGLLPAKFFRAVRERFVLYRRLSALSCRERNEDRGKRRRVLTHHVQDPKLLLVSIGPTQTGELMLCAEKDDDNKGLVAGTADKAASLTCSTRDQASDRLAST